VLPVILIAAPLTLASTNSAQKQNADDVIMFLVALVMSPMFFIVPYCMAKGFFEIVTTIMTSESDTEASEEVAYVAATLTGFKRAGRTLTPDA